MSTVIYKTLYSVTKQLYIEFISRLVITNIKNKFCQFLFFVNFIIHFAFIFCIKFFFKSTLKIPRIYLSYSYSIIFLYINHMLRNHAFRVRLLIAVIGLLLIVLFYYLIHALTYFPLLSVVISNRGSAAECELCKEKPRGELRPDSSPSPIKEQQYGVVIDAGSSGSRVFVYTWPQPTGVPGELLHVEHAYTETSPTQRRRATLKVDCPLSGIQHEPQNASNVMEPLLDFAARVIPERLRRASPLFILATVFCILSLVNFNN